MSNPPPPPPPSSYPPSGNAYGPRPQNGMGTASLVLGIIGVVFSWTLIFGFIPGILAVIFGSIGRGRAKRGEATNRGMATAGLVLGAIALVIVVVFFAALVAGGGHYCFHAGTDPNPCPS